MTENTVNQVLAELRSHNPAMIKFNVPVLTGKEEIYIADVLSKRMFSGSHEFNKKCNSWLKERFAAAKAMLVPSCTHALEMSAILADIQEGDEVIMSSFAFSSTANAFVLRGARIVFIDVRPDTMNMDEDLIERAITDKTKAIVALHYAGVPCEMGRIVEMGQKYGLVVVEDAAQAILSRYNGKYCGTLGDLGCFSFHETKNIQCGEGGALIINNPGYVSRAEIIREKGTDRERFFRGEVDKYTWVDMGSSYLLNEISAAFLYAQFEIAEEIIADRIGCWNKYYDLLSPLSDEGLIDVPHIPDSCEHNGHIFFIKVKDAVERQSLMDHLRSRGIFSVFHYIPLHSSPAGGKYGRLSSDDRWVTKESERLLRLPLYYKMGSEDIVSVVDNIYKFFGRKAALQHLS